MERPVFILGSHKSGTTLLRNLINGAEDMFVVPLETHFFQFAGFWVQYALRRTPPKELTFDEMLDAMRSHLQRSNAVTSTTSDSVLVGHWDIPRFDHWMRERAQQAFFRKDWRGVFNAYIEAIHVGLFGSPPHAHRFLEKSVEHAEFASLLKQLYPDATFVHIIRNPYATLVSLRRHMTIAGYPMLEAALASLETSYYYLFKNPYIVPDYLVVRYEDLLQHPEQTMRRIAAHIDIPFTEQLLIPTQLNEPWHGNSSTGRAFDGISTQPITAWMDSIHPLEAAFVNLRFSHVLRTFGYKPFPTQGSIYRPARGENLKTYLKNRCLWLLHSRSGLFPT